MSTDSIDRDPTGINPTGANPTGFDWVAVLDDLELSILEGSEFVEPAGAVPAEHAPRLHALLALCAERIGGVQAELASTGDELSRLVAARGTAWGSGQEPLAVTFSQSL